MQQASTFALVSGVAVLICDTVLRLAIEQNLGVDAICRWICPVPWDLRRGDDVVALCVLALIVTAFDG
jgi:hypothetical protein